MNLLSLCNKYMLSCLSLTFYTFSVPRSKFSPSTFRNPVLTVLRTTTCFLQEAKQVNSFAPHSKRQLRPLHCNRLEQSESTRDREGIRQGINHYKSAREVAKQVTESMPWDEACCELRLIQHAATAFSSFRASLFNSMPLQSCCLCACKLHPYPHLGFHPSQSSINL